MELLSELVEQPFYDELRTKQQLGYLVFSGPFLDLFLLLLSLICDSCGFDGSLLKRTFT